MPDTAPAGTDIASTTGFTRTSSAPAAATDSVKNSVTVFPTVSDASLSCFAPAACPVAIVDPMARPTIMTVIICMTWLPTETAVMLPAP